MEALGIDIGGSGIKGAPVELSTGDVLAPRFRIPTPEPATPEAVAEIVGEVAKHFTWTGKIGCGFPAIMKSGVAFSAANVDQSWIGADAATLFTQKTGCQTYVINDADAAGLAEMAFGAGKGENGVVILITIGTGIGSAVFLDGKLVPNTELGHIQLRGKDAEKRTSDAARQRKEMTWPRFGKRLNEYIQKIEFLVNPDLIIVGGGVSKDFDKFAEKLNVRARIIPARFLNMAGIVGAALATEC
jgi:polyphosphate glucokinase